MANLATIIRATRRSATALAWMARHARDAAEASATLEHNAKLVACGRMTAESAAIGNRIAQERKAAAERGHASAKSRYERAQATLRDNPLPGDLV